jgi:hypothetical protein
MMDLKHCDGRRETQDLGRYWVRTDSVRIFLRNGQTFLARPRWTYSTKSNHELNEELPDGFFAIFLMPVIVIQKEEGNKEGAPVLA